VNRTLELGAVETIIINEGKEDKELEEKAKQYGTIVEVISKDTREGDQLFQIGGIGGLLRWKA